jgi:hypothetical protein
VLLRFGLRPDLRTADPARLDHAGKVVGLVDLGSNLAHGSNTADLEKVDKAWPALNSGGNVSIQPFEGATKEGAMAGKGYERGRCS